MVQLLTMFLKKVSNFKIKHLDDNKIDLNSTSYRGNGMIKQTIIEHFDV